MSVLLVAEVAAQAPYPHLRLMAPAAPGGGWDQTARAMQPVLQSLGLVQTSSVENVPGAAGTIGLARMVSAERGNGGVAMVTGLTMLSGIETHRSVLTFGDVTPIARLLGEYEVVGVSATSPYQSLSDLLIAFRARPESVSWGGGSAGGADHILAGLIAESVGVDPRRVNYIAFAGGGEAMSAILGGQVSAGIGGLAEFVAHVEAGAVRVLGISSAARLPTLDAPTLREQGVDVELESWRCVVAPPGVSAEDRLRLEATIARMAQSDSWRAALARYRWTDRFLAGPAFARFVSDEEARVQAILRKLGTARAEGSEEALGPYPFFVLAGLALTALAFASGVVRSRGRVAEPAGAGWRAVAMIGAGVIVDLLLIERLGFVPASAALCWLTARAFDDRHPLRDAAFAVALSFTAYFVFARLLQLSLPAGVLWGWL
jgi:putative tricarboxylic transport membrane protein